MEQSQKSGYRWVIVWLLFAATTINYIDRQVIGLLKPVLSKDLRWSETDYSHIVMAFQSAYAIGLLFFGMLTDRIGTRLGYIISIVIWSISAMLHALARTTLGFGWARAGLGLGESGNFPVAIKSVAEWFPKKERAFATGIFNSGTNIGAVVAPIVIPWILGNYGWQEAFVWTGLLGFIWLIFWLIFYEIPSRQKRLSREEFEYIHSDDNPAELLEKPPGWGQLLRIRKTWAFVVGKFLSDPIWWFMLFWLPSYFSSRFNLDLSKPSWPLAIIYSATTIGSIGGGYISSFLIRRGWPVSRARRTTMLVVAFCVVPVMLAQYVTNMWAAVALIGLAASAHQAWSANIFTTASDMFPKRTVSSIVGIGGMAGSVGGILFPLLVGFLLDHFKALGNINIGYNILFFICGCAYLVAWLLMQLLLRVPSGKAQGVAQ